MTITEKILAEHVGLDSVTPGDMIQAKIDIAFANDVTAPLAIKEFQNAGATKVFDNKKIILIPDHFTPNKDILSAEQCKKVEEFAREYKIENYYPVGTAGIGHAFLPEEGLVVPGDLVIGADSHTCTYGALGAFSTGVGSTDLAASMITGFSWFRVPESIKIILNGKPKKWVSGKDIILYIIGRLGVDGALYKAIEFYGETVKYLSMDSRLTLCNMVVEAGAKNGIIAPDKITIDYMNGRAARPLKIHRSDEDAIYKEVFEIDVDHIEPQVAFPHSPQNTRGISEVPKILLDQVVIGSCTNGYLEDLRTAARVMDGRVVVRGLRLIIIPATQKIYLEALRQGLIELFITSGAAVSTPTCGPCLGGHMGVLAGGERALATTNRNFRGRMGHPESEVYLCNPAVAAASAVLGYIASPEEVVN